MFENAKKNAPCIIFIDERWTQCQRGAIWQATGRVHQTLNQMLVEMDGFEPTSA